VSAAWAVTADRPLRVLQVGAGGMGRTWLGALADREDVELVGLVELDVPGGRKAVADHGLDVEVGSDLAAMAARTDPDFVLDVTVPPAHHAVTKQALELGLPVLGEKPLAETLREAVDLAATATRTGQLFVVSQSRRYHAGMFALRDALPHLGETGIITTEFYRAPHFGGFREQMAHVLLLDMAIHQFDSARFLFGSDPIAVYCEEYNPSWSWYSGAAAATAVFEMEGGARYIYHGSWCSPGTETSWEGSWRVSGSLGSAVWTGEQPPMLDITESTGEPVVFTGTTELPGHSIRGSLADFVRALRTGKAPMGEVHDNLNSLAMVHAAIASAAQGRRIRLADVLAEAGR
jgi:predicted dehydrogenase